MIKWYQFYIINNQGNCVRFQNCFNMDFSRDLLIDESGKLNSVFVPPVLSFLQEYKTFVNRAR